jgi:hypothetical protein
MPLAFQSTDHGTVPFGYFNIDTDLLLLRHHLFFTDAFTGAIGEVTATADDVRLSLAGWSVSPARLGHVMGAIHGYDRSGFIGAVYQRFEFPSRPEEFHQRAEGARNRGVVEALLGEWAEPAQHRLIVQQGSVRLANTTFEDRWFRELVAYVWRGGYPRWLAGERPPEVLGMHDAVVATAHPLFVGQPWELELCRA